MTNMEEQREKVISGLADLLRTSEFSVEYCVKKKPKGIKVIIEVTQEQLKTLVESQRDKFGK